jgi:hypothetical protein
MLLIRHIDRSLAALERRYKAREALDGELSAEQAEERDTCMRYRESLPSGRLVWTVIGFAVSGLVLVSVLVHVASSLSNLPSYGPHLQAQEKRIQGVLVALASAAASGGNIRDMSQVMAKGLNLNVGDLWVLLVDLFLVGYLLTRPFVPAFRLKRQILNLAGQDDRDVRDTASSWHVNKSVGAYQQERKVFAARGYRPPREFPLDLVALTFPVFCLSVLAVALARKAAVSLGEPRDVDFGLPLLLWSLSFAGLGILRAVWLRSAWRGRQDPEQTPPLVGVAGGTGGYVEARPVTEVVAWPFATALVAAILVGVLLQKLSPSEYPGTISLAGLLYPPLAAIPFYRFALTGDRMRAAAAIRYGCRSRRGRPLLAALAFASIIVTPIVVLVHLWRLTALRGIEESARRRYRALAALAFPILLVLTMFAAFAAARLVQTMIAPARLALLQWMMDFRLEAMFAAARLDLPQWMMEFRLEVMFAAALSLVLYALLMGAIQRCQNRLVAEEDIAAPVLHP